MKGDDDVNAAREGERLLSSSLSLSSCLFHFRKFKFKSGKMHRTARRAGTYVCSYIDIWTSYVYMDSAACRWQRGRTTAEKIIKHAECKMQMPLRDVHENGQKAQEMYIRRETRDASA